LNGAIASDDNAPAMSAMRARRHPHDSTEPPSIVRQGENTFIADARASLEDVREMIGDAFDTGEAGEEVETLGGFIVTHVGRLPVRGEIISGPGEFEIEVLDADPRRVKRLRIGPRKERPALRPREQRRRDAAPDTNPPSNERPASPSGSGGT
jgi:Mg2+/Co2+ transporter CorC